DSAPLCGEPFPARYREILSPSSREIRRCHAAEYRPAVEPPEALAERVPGCAHGRRGRRLPPGGQIAREEAQPFSAENDAVDVEERSTRRHGWRVHMKHGDA